MSGKLRRLLSHALDALLCACWLLLFAGGIAWRHWESVRLAAVIASGHILCVALQARIRKLERRNAQLERAVRVDIRPDGSILVSVDATAWQDAVPIQPSRSAS